MNIYIRCFIVMFISLLIASCQKEVINADNNNPDIPLGPNLPQETVYKTKSIWIDAHANLKRFSTKESIKECLTKIKDVGFDLIYLDVKPGIGYALYESDILPKLEKWGSETVKRDWDYLAFWLEEAEKLEIGIVPSISVLGFGNTMDQEGLVFDSQQWNGKTQVEMRNNDPSDLVDIISQKSSSAAMLDPSIPEVQSFVVSVVEELVRKYPKIKGVSLDYCRWYDSNYGFGYQSIKAFENYSGLKVNSLNQIITSTGGIGPLYKHWIEFRTMCITNLIANIKTKVKSIDSELDIHLWASADWGSRFSVGQNWASNNYIPTNSSRYSDKYSQTGFANQLDVFVLGAYAYAVWINENPNSVWSVEYFVNNYNRYIMDDCKVYGSIPAYLYDSKKISDAIYLCLKNTDGLMVFEISHIIDKNLWNTIKQSIESMEN